MNLELKGRVALVIGGTSGLGLAIGRALADEGVAVALAGRRRDLAREEAGRLAGAIGVELDLRESESISNAVANVGDALGHIDILILNSGGPPPMTAVELELSDVKEAAELLLYGPLQLVNACIPGMCGRKWGRIVALGSTSVHQPIRLLATSSMFRAALASYLKLLSEDVAGDGVTVNMVHPGRIATDRTIEIDRATAERDGISSLEARAISERSIPIGRYGTPEEFAALVAFLCSDGARYITGEQIRVDGGLIRAL